MKRLLFALALATALPMATTSCQSDNAQLYAVQTLLVTGQTAKATLDGAAIAVREGGITVQQWFVISAFYDTKFQPAYRLAVGAAHGDVTALSNQDVAMALSDFIALVNSLKK